MLDEVCAEKGAGLVVGYFHLFVKISYSLGPEKVCWNC